MVKGDKQGVPNRGFTITTSGTHTKKFSEEHTKTDQGLVVPRLRKACLGTVFALNVRREAASGELDSGFGYHYQARTSLSCSILWV